MSSSLCTVCDKCVFLFKYTGPPTFHQLTVLLITRSTLTALPTADLCPTLPGALAERRSQFVEEVLYALFLLEMSARDNASITPVLRKIPLERMQNTYH